jgi:transcriptional regulator with XRE-family HTH domain
MKTPNFIDRHVGSRLRQLRLSRGVAAQDLARMLGISASRLAALEEGRERIAAETMRQLSRVLRAPPSEFFEGLAPGHADAMAPTAEEKAEQEKRLIADFARIRDAKSREVILALVAAYAEFGDADAKG